MPAQKPSTSKQDYATPEDFIKAVKRQLGITAFEFDFAADASNAKAASYWTERDDSLSKGTNDWALRCSDGWGWLNPPFKDIGPWALRCKQAAGRGGSVALLVPAAIGANWYRDHVHPHAFVMALNGRLCFISDWATTIDPATLKPEKGPPRFYLSAPLYPKDCVLCLFSKAFVPDFDVWSWRD